MPGWRCRKKKTVKPRRMAGVRKILAGCLAAAILLGGTEVLWQNQIPDKVYVAEEGELETLKESWILPLSSWITKEVVSNPAVQTSGKAQAEVQREAGLSIKTDTQADTQIRCSFLGIVPIKNVEVCIKDPIQVYPGGEQVGIYMKTQGVLVVGTGKVTGSDGMSWEPARNVLQSGDYIVKVNGRNIATKKELTEAVEQCQGEELVLTINRDESYTDLKLSPVLTEGQEYRLGIWVRDDTQGIGTLTYVDEEGNFGALGHGISDVDTGTLLELKNGRLYHASILSLVKGLKGAPGELSGVIRYRKEELLGIIEKNTRCGIFGTLNENGTEYETGELVETAYKQDVHTGKAVIRCAVAGELKDYEIEIEKVEAGGGNVNKNMVLHITDPKLLELTGGILQGMSGSPILQDGKLIGAVTHVFVKDPTRGYGIFIENMLEQE